MFPIIMNPDMILNPGGANPVTPSTPIKEQIGIDPLLRAGIIRGGVPDNIGQIGMDLWKRWFNNGNDPGPKYIYNYSSPRTFEYVNADLAKQYGMNKITAYNEAMANTAYQRAVADMQAAGLNPASLFSASRASSAGSGHASGVSSGGFSSASGAVKGDQLPGWIFYGAQALAQAVGTLVTGNPSTGFVTSQVVGNLLRAFNGR